HTRSDRDWSSDVCSSDLFFSVLDGNRVEGALLVDEEHHRVVRREQLEGDLQDLVEEGFLIALEADEAVKLVGDAQLLVVLPQRRSEERRVGKGGNTRWSH